MDIFGGALFCLTTDGNNISGEWWSESEYDLIIELRGFMDALDVEQETKISKGRLLTLWSEYMVVPFSDSSL